MSSILRSNAVGPVKIQSSTPRNRSSVMSPCKWGYKDSAFVYNNNQFTFTGSRYNIANGLPFVTMKSQLEELNHLKVDELKEPPRVEHTAEMYPPPVDNLEFIEAIKSAGIDYTKDFQERLFRLQSQSAKTVYKMYFERCDRIADLIIFPSSHQDVEVIVKLANEFDVALIPIGGATNTSGSATAAANEQRCIAAVDCTQMNRMMWFDSENFLACFESGAIGQDIERVLNKKDYTLGHEPDSLEFSTLGGWISTRASGMKRGKYGNIEECVKNIKMVTSIGTIQKSYLAPRVSHGPNFEEMILGSEGIFGIVTEAVVKIYPNPSVKRYGSIVFHDFNSGFDFMREVAKVGCQPASLRLVDNSHYVTSTMLKQSKGVVLDAVESLKHGYLSTIKRYNFKTIAIATFLFEGEKDEIDQNEKIIQKVAQNHRGYYAGEHYGKSAYEMTFCIAYIRDWMVDAGFACESYETSVVWSKCKQLISNVENFWNLEIKKRNVKTNTLAYRISQVYHDGVCCYFYFSIRLGSAKESFDVMQEVLTEVYDVIHSSGGALSHHHGIGKKMKGRYQKCTSDVELKMLKAIKREIDPKNIFASGNIFDNSVDETNLSSKL